jgi:hypothetical protein
LRFRRIVYIGAISDARWSIVDRDERAKLGDGASQGGDQTSTEGIMILLKLSVLSLPGTLLPLLRPTHSHLAFGLALILGALLQAIIPPRRKGFIIVLGAIVFTLIYSFV